jgi:general secretion pathway protein G
MERNIVTGEEQQADGRRQTAKRENETSPRAKGARATVYCLVPTGRRGFTLLELMIVITVIIILAAIVLPQYQRTILATREAVLREDLFKMRALLDQYAADKQKLPQSLDDLVTAGYMRELPKDPVSGQPDWTVTTGEDPNSSSGEQGVTDVHSSSADVSSEGTPYSEW